MDVVSALILLAVLTVSSLGPGLLLLPRLPVEEDERLVVVVATSWIAVFLAGFGVYLCGLPVACSWGVTAGCAACVGFRWKTLRRLLAAPPMQAQMAGLGLALAHTLLLQASIRGYNGLSWVGDWYEHFERTMFFIDRPDAISARFLAQINEVGSGYVLTARPPFMNVLTAHAVAHGGPAFAAFQVASTWLSVLAALPTLALVGRFSDWWGVRERTGVFAAAAALVLHPAFNQNATFTWTKLLAAFYVLAALLIVAGRKRDGSPARLALAGACMGAGVAVHYSAAVYAVVLGMAIGAEAAWTGASAGRTAVVRRLVRASIAALAFGGPMMAMLLPWLGFSLATFGVTGTLATNTTVTDSAALTPLENLLKIVLNGVDTLVPHFLRSQPPIIAALMQQANRSAAVRDWWFAPLQVNFPFALGTATQAVAAGLAAWLLARASSTASRRDAAFWAWFTGASFLLGVAVHGTRDTLGVAHVCLQPLILVGATVAVAALPRLHPAVRGFALLGLAWDYLVGVILHLSLEQLPVEVFDVDSMHGRWFGLAGATVANTGLKTLHRLAFLGDAWPGARLGLCACAWGLGLAAWLFLAAIAWRGPAGSRPAPSPRGE